MIWEPDRWADPHGMGMTHFMPRWHGVTSGESRSDAALGEKVRHEADASATRSASLAV